MTRLLFLSVVVLLGMPVFPLAADPQTRHYSGVENEQRAWQNWVLNCQGCHSPEAMGFPNATPKMAGEVAKFLSVPGGREYLGRVPGVATAPLSNRDLAELVNWMLPRFDAAHMPADFKPYTAEEIADLRGRILRTDANSRRAELIARMPSDRPEYR